MEKLRKYILVVFVVVGRKKLMHVHQMYARFSSQTGRQLDARAADAAWHVPPLGVSRDDADFSSDDGGAAPMASGPADDDFSSDDGGDAPMAQHNMRSNGGRPEKICLRKCVNVLRFVFSMLLC